MDNSDGKGASDTPKRNPFDDLNRDDLIIKCKGLLAIAQKAKQAKSECQIELDKIKKKEHDFENEKKGLLNNIKTLEELVDSLTEQKLNYITEIDVAQNKIKTYEDKLNIYDEEIKKHKADVIIRDQKLANVLQKLSDVDSEITSLKRQNNRLMEENEQLISQLTEMESRTVEFNDIGLQQREQLQLLEQKVQDETVFKIQLEELSNKIMTLESNLSKITTEKNDLQNENMKNRNKIEELSNLYEGEKSKKEKANIKLKSYRDKILKCASCINQLKNSRFILTKTVNEYSENIPKWQNEIIKASKILDDQMNVLNKENLSLKERIDKLEKQLTEVNMHNKNASQVLEENIVLENNNLALKNDISNLKQQLKDSLDTKIKIENDLRTLNKNRDIEISEKIKENDMLKHEINTKVKELYDIQKEMTEITLQIENLKSENETLKSNEDKNTKENLILQLKALESEKSILVKEKLTAKDNIIELENQNKLLSNENDKIKADFEIVKLQLESVCKDNENLKLQTYTERDEKLKEFENNIAILNDQNTKLKKEFEILQDENGLLREEVETLKLSLEQPKDNVENLSDLNVSLQADLAKLETKLSNYKQENSSLLIELKECRGKVKEYDNIVVEYEDIKTKLLGYKTENNELLNEMKEINQVLKERGEAISKLQKAISEMEHLIETLEKDRDEKNEKNVELLDRITVLESYLKSSEDNTNKSKEDNEKLITERDTTLSLLKEKESLIVTLKEELERLKTNYCNVSELPNEDMSTSTISKAEEHSRMKDLDETFEDKYTKLRIFALKLKKKLNETTTQLQNSEQEKLKLKKMLDDKNTENKTKSMDEVDSSTNPDNEKSKAEIMNLESKIRSLTSAIENLEVEKSQLNEQLATEKSSHKSTKEQLEKAMRDVKKKNVLSLEMEDYEKSMKELTTKMEEKKNKIVQMESTIDVHESTITAMKTQIKLLEEQIKTDETQNRVLKEEVQHSLQESKEKDNVISTKNNIISKLMQELEDEKRKNEEADLEMTSLLSEKEKIIMSFGEERIELNNKMKKLEFKCAETNENLRITSMELADLKTEYTSYKVRAQAVLRQNQTIDHSQEEQLKEETAALKAQTESLSLKLNTLQEKYSEQSAELEAARKRVAEASLDASRAQQRTTRLQTDLTRLSQQLESERAQHKLQISTLTQCYKSQITDLEVKLQKETENLRKQLATVQESVKTGRFEEDLNRDKYTIPVIPKEDTSDTEMDINVSMIPREEGEGSESAPSPPLSKSFLSGGSRRSPVPLERLLEEGVAEDDTLDTSSLALTPEQEITDLKRKVLTLQQRVKHVTVLLAESERECARMSQLSDLLKSELRRVRGSSQNAHNTEYMKNVTLKFLTLPPGDERSRLVPVLQKILTLSSEEMQKIQAVAKGHDPNPSKSWGSYLPWPGGK
ncbi:GRIP and coiled-coil domain-containing protein 2-like [Zerene cesonia]|uniref:GRIP and coiled-coil domain-containing protein 2-like n=2 Tax=Zerene cesonia TaxID=33412 RepID=UPI0018E52B2E|nr:GRIP and coiled-coil domain-containing protein 2-like [Zerene cesonia]